MKLSLFIGVLVFTHFTLAQGSTPVDSSSGVGCTFSKIKPSLESSSDPVCGKLPVAEQMTIDVCGQGQKGRLWMADQQFFFLSNETGVDQSSWLYGYSSISGVTDATQKEIHVKADLTRFNYIETQSKYANGKETRTELVCTGTLQVIDSKNH